MWANSNIGSNTNNNNNNNIRYYSSDDDHKNFDELLLEITGDIEYDDHILMKRCEAIDEAAEVANQRVIDSTSTDCSNNNNVTTIRRPVNQLMGAGMIVRSNQTRTITINNNNRMQNNKAVVRTTTDSSSNNHTVSYKSTVSYNNSNSNESNDQEVEQLQQLILSDEDKQLEDLFSAEINKESIAPLGYSSITVMESFMKGKKEFEGIRWERRFKGQPIETLSELIPQLVKYVEGELDKRVGRERDDDAKVIREEWGSPRNHRKRLPTGQVSTQKYNLTSTLGQYFQYIRHVEAAHHNTKNLSDIPISVIMLIDRIKIKGYLKFLGVCYTNAKTRRNKAQNLAKILNKFRSSNVLSTARQTDIEACLSMVKDSANYDAIKARECTSTIYKEIDLINAGFFPGKKEKVAFIQWMHKQLVKGMEIDEFGDGLSIAEAHEWQDFFMTFIQPFFCGLRREVTAGIHVDRIKILSREGQKDELVLTPGLEKRPRSKDDKIPIPYILEPLFLFFLNKVRPSLIEYYGNFNPMTLWISRRGNALEYKVFSAIIVKISKKFNPLLNISPIQWRRMYISDVFANRIATAEIPLQQFILELGDYLNVTPKVMDGHYNRASKFDGNKSVQYTLTKDLMEELDDTYNQSLELSNYSLSDSSNISEYAGSKITRLMRETTDDTKWDKIYTNYLLEKEVALSIRKRKRSVFDSSSSSSTSDDEILEDNQQALESDISGEEKLFNKKRFISSSSENEFEFKNEPLMVDDKDFIVDQQCNNSSAFEDDVADIDEQHNLADVDDDEEPEFEVESILNKKFDLIQNQVCYLVKWKGFSRKDATWEPLISLHNCLHLVNSFEIQRKIRTNKKARENLRKKIKIEADY